MKNKEPVPAVILDTEEKSKAFLRGIQIKTFAHSVYAALAKAKKG